VSFVTPADAPLVLELPLPPFRLEAGAALLAPRARVWFFGSAEEQARLARGERLPLDPTRPSVCILHTSTGALDPTLAYPELFGKGRPLRPWAARLVAVGLTGSAHDPTGPSTGRFPTRRDDTRHPEPAPLARGDSAHARHEQELPATVTTWDQARALVFALTQLGLVDPAIDSSAEATTRRLSLLFGASLGGMVVLTAAALLGARLERGLVVAAPATTGAHVIAHDHLIREALLSDPAYPRRGPGLALARQVALFGYRGREALEKRQGRDTAGPRHEGAPAWNPRAPYRVETYFRHHGDSFDYDPASLLTLLGAMDHHDLSRTPPFARAPALPASMKDRIRARLTFVGVSSDGFVPCDEVRASARALGADFRVIESDYGHDGFLVEKVQLAHIVRAALKAPFAARRGPS
jgi:homoserine O-acetyltransferase